MRRAAPLLRQVFRQRAAWHVLEHDIGLAALHIGLEHRHDVGVGQSPDVARLAQPDFEHRCVLPLHGRHELDGDLALQARVLRQPHRGLRALAQHALQFKPPQKSGLCPPSPHHEASGGGERGKIRHGVDGQNGQHTLHCPMIRILCLQLSACMRRLH